MRRPAWMNKKVDYHKQRYIKNLLKNMALYTVCEEARCPNMSECFSNHTATFLILGNACTRDCRFCGIGKGEPDLVDVDEPYRIAQAVQQLGLRHVVITSVTRDDLGDGGAFQFVRTIEAIRAVNLKVKIELLVPDFDADKRAIGLLVERCPWGIAHNIETVKRLYPLVRGCADYQRSLFVLQAVKDLDKKIYTKSSIILGLGETEEEVIDVFVDLRRAGCDFLVLGQYLMPTRTHFPVQRFLKPEQFDYYKQKAYQLGFKHVLSTPYARSSYRAIDCSAED